MQVSISSPNNWPDETGTALYFTGFIFRNKLRFATTVYLAVFDMEADPSFALSADGHAPAVPGPKSPWPGSS